MRLVTDEGAIEADAVPENCAFTEERPCHFAVEADTDSRAEYRAGPYGGELPHPHARPNDDVLSDEGRSMDLGSGVDAVRMGESRERAAMPLLPRRQEVSQLCIAHVGIRGVSEHPGAGCGDVVADT